MSGDRCLILHYQYKDTVPATGNVKMKRIRTRLVAKLKRV